MLKKLKPSNAENHPVEILKREFLHCDDITIRTWTLREIGISLIFAENLIDSSFINKFILPRLNHNFESYHEYRKYIINEIQLEPIEKYKVHDLTLKVLEGNILLVVNEDVFAATSSTKFPKRTPEEPTTEPSIKGPRDGFIEDINTNIALVRKRLKTTELKVEKYMVGKRSQTTVAILYLKDVINPELLSDLKNKMENIPIDVVSSLHQLEKFLSSQPYTLIPTFDSTGRPDFAVAYLNQGKFLLLVDGQPTVSIAPIQISNLFKSPEDESFNYGYVSFERILRLGSLLVSILLPGTWVALTTHNIEQIPYQLVATVSLNRSGLPFSTPFEMVVMLLIFELFNEAGLRLPRSSGQTVSVLGGLIIGDAAIRSGITSPPMLIVGALTFISGLTLVNQSLSSNVTFFRVLIFLLGSMFGIFGVVIGVFMMLAYLTSINSFGVPIMSMTYPFNIRNLSRSFLRLPWNFYKTRGDLASPKDKTRQEE